MSAGPPQHFPPPGAPLPEEPRPAAPPPPPGAAGPGLPPPPAYGTWTPPQVALAGAFHRPGAIPLRPLTLGNVYDGAFRIIRHNPGATVGAAVLVTAVAMALPLLVSTILTFAAGVSLDLAAESGSEEISTGEALGIAGVYGSLLIGAILSSIGTTLVTGPIACVVHAAAVGRTMRLGDAWAATRGKRWRLVGMSLLLFLAVLAIWLGWGALLVVVIVATGSPGLSILWGVLSFVGAVVLMLWSWIKLFLIPVPILMLEPVGVFAAFGRSWRLTTGQYWRLLGIALLAWLIASVAGGILSSPFSILSPLAAGLFPDQAIFIVTLGQALSSIAQNAFVAPFSAAVASLLYLDVRMRREGHDVELMREAGLLPAD